MNPVLGIDIGTSTIAMIIMDMDTQQPVVQYNLANQGRILGQPAWLQDPVVISQQILNLYQSLRQRYAIARIGITCQMHGIVYVNAAGQAVSPLYTWQDEHGELPFLNEKTYRQQLNALTGYQQIQGIATGSITHFYFTQTGQIPAGAVQFCTIGDYIAMLLTQSTAPLVHLSNAAGFGLVDIKTGTYDQCAIASAGMDAKFFPKICKGYVQMGHTPEHIPVSVAIGDNQASFLGATKDCYHQVLLNLGTGGQISRHSDQLIEGHGLESRPFLENDFIVVYTSHCGGRAYAALESFFHQVLSMAGVPLDQPLYDAMEQAVRSLSVTSVPPTVEPAFCGTRSNPNQRCNITGLTLENFTPGNFVYGFLEGICRELLPAYQYFCQMGDTVQLVGAGNAIRKNKALQEIIPRVFGQPLYLSAQEEAAAAGAAVYASRT